MNLFEKIHLTPWLPESKWLILISV